MLIMFIPLLKTPEGHPAENGISFGVIVAAKPTQVNKIININDSVISRSNLNFEGEENVEDSVIHKNSKD